MPLARVLELWRYPVKSMAGERLQAADITLAGIPGDRSFGIVEQARGRVLSAKLEPRLLDGAARVAGEGEVLLDVPGLGELSSDDPGVHELLSGWLDRDVRLVRPEPGHRTTIAGDEDFLSPAGSFFDSRSSLHLLTDASLAAAAELLPDSDWDARRFRPNLLLAADSDGFAEEGWSQQQVRLGSALAQVRKPTKRCVLITRPQPGLPPDKDVLRVLARERDSKLGVYANPVEAGQIALGDPVTMQPDGTG